MQTMAKIKEIFLQTNTRKWDNKMFTERQTIYIHLYNTNYLLNLKLDIFSKSINLSFQENSIKLIMYFEM